MLDWENLNKYRENNRLEAKKAQGGLPRSIWETYSAFANTFGGILLLGVVEEEDKSFSSVPLRDPDQLAADFWNTLTDGSTVSANILTSRDVQVVESSGNRIVVIEVPRADRHNRPVFIGKDPFSGTYRRNGEGDYRCTAEEVRSMIRDRTDISRDTRILAGLTLTAFDRESIHRYYLRLERMEGMKAWSSLPLLAFLEHIGAINWDQAGRLRPTAAGLLMFGREPQITWKFPDYLLDYQEIMGPNSIRIVSNSGDWSGNLFDFYCRVYERMAQELCMPEDGGILQALGEALANALIHADYQDRRGLTILRFPNRIRIANPGAFRVDVRDAMAGGAADPRNSALIQMFHLIGVGRQAGLAGICAVWQERGWKAPEIVECFGPDRTILTLPLSRREAPRRRLTTEDRKQAIIEYLTDAATATVQQIAHAVGLSSSRTLVYLRQLRRSGVLEQTAAEHHYYRLKA